MKFVASITAESANRIKTLRNLWTETGDVRNPFSDVLITPLFTSLSTLDLVNKNKVSGEIHKVYFDSGGYFVQTGKITYQDMYWRLLNFYRHNNWADYYVLPDDVPVPKKLPKRGQIGNSHSVNISLRLHVT